MFLPLHNNQPVTYAQYIVCHCGFREVDVEFVRTAKLLILLYVRFLCQSLLIVIYIY